MLLGFEREPAPGGAAAGYLCCAHVRYESRLFADAERAARRARQPNLATLMFLPYARIVPMHVMNLAGD